jgi:opacity protein-like surface antigen
MFGLYSASQAQFIKNIGIKIGGTVSRQKWEYAPESLISLDPDSKIGFNVGVFAEFLDLPFISVVGEVNYVEKGMQMDVYLTDLNSGELAGEQLHKAGFNYLNFSLLAKVRLDGIIFTPYLIAGPKVDFELNKKGEFITNSNLFNDFKKSRFGFKAGIGTEVKLFKITFLAEVLYDADFGLLYEGGLLKVTSSAVDFRTGVSISL